MRICQRLALGMAALAVIPAVPARAERIQVEPGADLPAILASAAEGDVIVLKPGEHRGPLRLAKPLVLEGEAGARVAGSGRGSVIVVAAPGAVVRQVTVTGSGFDPEAMDAGIFLEKTATGAIVERNRVEGNLYGVYIHGAEDSVVQDNAIVGLQEGRVNEAGNGVSVWNAPGAKVLRNDIRFGRDGIFSITSKRNVFSGNRFRDLRFAIHYMYTNDSEISDNVSSDNSVGFAIMFSHRLKVTGNQSEGDRDHGFLFNYANGSQITGNLVLGRLQTAERWLGARAKDASEHGLPAAEDKLALAGDGFRPGPTKCVFIYNANQNRFRDNRFEGCEIGIHFTAGSERNEVVGNAFIGNRNQVKYVSTRHIDWSKDGQGNFWSDNPAFDLNGDGVADSPYRPNDLMDKVLWSAPQAKVLANSPAVQVIRWAQAQFPALLPGGVVDSHPLMAPPPRQPAQSGAGR